MAEHDESKETKVNRSFALSPEVLAIINSATAAAVENSVKSILEGFLPHFEAMALTPEKLREANKPYQDPAKIKRDEREAKKSKEDMEELHRLTKLRQDNCAHLDKNGRSSINIVHNYHDHQPRGACVLCGAWIHPREWRIGVPNEQYPRGVPELVEPHKDYRIVMQLETMQ